MKSVFGILIIIRYTDLLRTTMLLVCEGLRADHRHSLFGLQELRATIDIVLYTLHCLFTARIHIACIYTG